MPMEAYSLMAVRAPTDGLAGFQQWRLESAAPITRPPPTRLVRALRIQRKALQLVILIATEVLTEAAGHPAGSFASVSTIASPPEPSPRETAAKTMGFISG